MKLVILESPYRGDTTHNIDYARRCMRDSIMRGEAPIAPHLLYTQSGVLIDSIPSERALGIAAGAAWEKVADLHVFYTDLGWSEGMKEAYKRCVDDGNPVDIRTITMAAPSYPSIEMELPDGSD